ncbi:MAG: hypothetical protein VR70_08230 [Rhodospirillaceae bacterium BRH_c57]|nr:MAG: hypothetical protein VR70_08230 [Rhodospirillaceae bacterium BRH_c57]
MRSTWIPAIAILMFSGAAFAEEAHHPSAGGASATPAPQAAAANSAMMGSGMDSGMMQGGMMGMMHGGQASPGVAGCPLMTGGDLALNVEKARSLVAAHVVMMGNDRLRVGSVQAQGDDFVAEIETVDGSLVNRLTIDGKTGAMRPAT